MRTHPVLVALIGSILLLSGCGPSKERSFGEAVIQGTIDRVGNAQNTSSGWLQQGEIGQVEGWALFEDMSPPVGAVVTLDGKQVAETLTFLPRKDISAFFKRDVPACGFVVTFPTFGLGPGEHQVQVYVAKTRGGAPHAVPSVGTFRLFTKIQGTIDLVTGGKDAPPGVVQKGTVARAKGWGILADGSPPGLAVVTVDDNRVGQTSTFLPRSDVSAFFKKDLGACGYDISFPTTDLKPGDHVAQVLIAKNAGDAPQPLPRTATFRVIR